MEVYKFKVKDFTTIMIGQKYTDNAGITWFYVQRGDGEKYKYHDGIIQWSELIYSE